MNLKYGYTEIEWENTKNEIRRILIEVARNKRVISYSELANKIETIEIEPFAYAIGHLLGEISSEEDDAGRGMLSVVVHRSDENKPGKGFFELARTRGREIVDEDSLLIEEMNRVYEYWSNL